MEFWEVMICIIPPLLPPLSKLLARHQGRAPALFSLLSMCKRSWETLKHICVLAPHKTNESQGFWSWAGHPCLFFTAAQMFLVHSQCWDLNPTGQQQVLAAPNWEGSRSIRFFKAKHQLRRQDAAGNHIFWYNWISCFFFLFSHRVELERGEGGQEEGEIERHLFQ